MNEETFNLEIRRFLKQFGVTAQRELEKAVAAAIAERRLQGGETLAARAVLHVDGLGDVVTVTGTLALA